MQNLHIKKECLFRHNSVCQTEGGGILKSKTDPVNLDGGGRGRQQAMWDSS